jgi:MinD superfamily P-loop ATPase
MKGTGEIRKIAVASGKGGTGKTTVSVNLYHFIAHYWTPDVHLVDCDVEEPNDAIFFNHPVPKNREEVYQRVPEINPDACAFCRKCSDWCEYNAISIIPKLKFADVNTSLCHSCGACIIACAYGAITEKNKPLGYITHFPASPGKGLIEGRLEVGSAMQTLLIKKLKRYAEKEKGILILDAPPGTSCPVVETVADADFIILVTEPTPFGLHDLKITVELINELDIPFGVVVNKAGLGSAGVYTYLEENNIHLLGEIPFMREYAESYSSGNLLNHIPGKAAVVYRNIIEKLKQKETVI